MYTHDETNIIYADALQPHAALQPNSYDVLVANPPYAVTGFFETLSESDRKEFALFNGNIIIAKNNAIDTFLGNARPGSCVPVGLHVSCSLCPC